LASLQAFYNNAFSSQQAVNTALPPYTLAVDSREAVFAPVSKKRRPANAELGITHGL